MGGHEQRRRAGCPVLSGETVPAVRVVPAVPSFSVDEGFWYSKPDHLELSVGSLVRVPLGGRRVRGYVVELGNRESGRLKAVAARSGDAPIFEEKLLEALRWAARHYVAPLSVLLERAAPPNNPLIDRTRTSPPSQMRASPLPELSESAGAAKRRRAVVHVGPVPDGAWLGTLAGPVVGAGRSVLIVVPTAAEAVSAAEGSAEAGMVAEVVHGDMDDRQVTSAWAKCSRNGSVLIGTPRVASWRMGQLGLAVIVEDGRRAMKDRQTPAVHARDLLRERSKREGFALAVVGPTPSVEALGWGPEVVRSAGRAWPLVEVVDRRNDPPGSGLLGTDTRRAIQAVVRDGGSVFLFAHKRGYASALRCAECRALKRCASCGTASTGADPCRRCGASPTPCPECGGTRYEPLGAGVGRLVEEAGRVAGAGQVEAHPTRRPVAVGSERDLAGLDKRDLVVMVDFDGLLYGSSYRASEEALRIGARLAGKVGRGRMMVQTQDPSHPAVIALRRADPVEFLLEEVRTRSEFGYPPAGQLMVIEARGVHDVSQIDRELTETGSSTTPNPTILGPAGFRDGSRWLLQGPDLGGFKVSVRPLIQRWRDSGVTIRVDADPIDL